MKKDEMKEKEAHKCIYDELIIASDPCFADGARTLITVFVDCSCEESEPKMVVQFADNPVMSAEDNFKGWFQSTVSYFIQHGYKIKDNR